jgi:PKD repeat protein
MDKRSILLIIAGFFLITAALQVSYGDECNDCCGPFCDENICVLKCEHIYKNDPLIRGCAFWNELTGTCHNCQYGDMDIKSCPDYPGEKSCKENPCGIGAGCEWSGGYCSRKLVPAQDCRFIGCNEGYKCIPNGDCTALSIEEYCAGNNYPYSPALLSKRCDDPIFPPFEQALCRECQSDYELAKTSGDIREIVYGVAAGLAVLLLLMNALKLLTSEDAAARSGAKKGMVYILIGLIVIVSAVSFIEGVYKTPPVTPSSVSKPNQIPIPQALVGLAPLPSLKYLNTEKGVTVYFDASSSKDVDGAITEYRWDYGDGETASGAAVQHVYTDENIYTVKLTVLDDKGDEATDIVIVTTKGFEAVIFSPENGTIIYQIGRITEFRGAARYGTPCPPAYDYIYNWSWDGTFMSDKTTFTRNTLDLPLGKHTLTLSAKDCAGRDASNVTEVYVVKPLIAKILMPEKDGASLSETCVDDTVKLIGTAYGGLPPYKYKWTANNLVIGEGTISGEGEEETVKVKIGAGALPKGKYTIAFEITDSLGLRDTDSRQLINFECDKCAEYKSTGKLPEEFNWRNVDGKNYITRIRDQDGTGTCWAHATAGAMEGTYNVESGNIVEWDLSEKYLAGCFLGRCNPGIMPMEIGGLLSYVKNQGMSDEGCLPFGTTGCSCSSKCSDWQTRLWKSGEDGFVRPNPDDIKAALICKGPLFVASLNWQHAITLVGYSDKNNKWIIKNSWGTSWGNGGFGDIHYNSPYTDFYDLTLYFQKISRS